MVFAGALVIGGRLPDDVFPIFPIAAIAIGRLWEEFLFEGAGRLGRTLMTSFFLQIGVVALLALAVATFATVRYPREFAAVRPALIAPLVVLVVGPAVTAVLFSAGRYMRAFLALPGDDGAVRRGAVHGDRAGGRTAAADETARGRARTASPPR